MLIIEGWSCYEIVDTQLSRCYKTTEGNNECSKVTSKELDRNTPA